MTIKNDTPSGILIIRGPALRAINVQPVVQPKTRSGRVTRSMKGVVIVSLSPSEKSQDDD